PRFGRISDTWVWDGGSWGQGAVSSPQTPPARDMHAMVYDSIRQKIVMFGGNNGIAPLGDTWEWDSTTGWRQIQPANAPPARSGHAMSFDTRRGRTFLFGGTPFSNDTWEYNGNNWTRVGAASVAPPGRYRHAIAWDQNTSKHVLFGGL